jgi:lysozyme
MKTSEAGLLFLETHEGLRTHAYKDSGGELTIGIGHLLTRSELRSGKLYVDGLPLRYHYGLTKEQCYELLDQDLDYFEDIVTTEVNVKLTQNQFDALVSFVFNVGANAFINSTLLKVLDQGFYNAVPVQLMRWNKDNGKVVKGLTNRRNAEVELWNR